MLRIASLLLLTFVASLGSAVQAQNRFALLIGNQDYSTEVGRLRNPINDIQLVAKSLEQVGFQRNAIQLVRNADRLATLDAVDQYVERLRTAGDDAVGFFYYSGHGIANKRDKRNYLIPVGVKSLSRRVWFSAIPLDEIVRKLSQQASNAAHFVVFDACRNLLKTPTRGAKGFEPVQSRRGMLIAFSTDPGQTASDRGQDSGPYAAALSAQLKKPGLDHLDLFQNVKEQVLRTTGEQLPWTRDGMLRRVYLNGSAVPPSVEAAKEAPISQAAVQSELKAWKLARKSKNLNALESYLAQYPKGAFAGLARTMKQRLQESVDRTQRELPRLMQAELKRLGCLSGAVDGIWGNGSRRSMARFNKYAKLTVAATPTQDGLRILEQQKSQVCPAITVKTVPRVGNNKKTRPAAAKRTSGRTAGRKCRRETRRECIRKRAIGSGQQFDDVCPISELKLICQ